MYLIGLKELVTKLNIETDGMQQNVKEVAEEKVVLLEQLNRARVGVDNYTKLSQTFHQAQVRGHVMRYISSS